MEERFTLAYVWGIYFWKAFLERPKIFRLFCKIFMGRYAWNELCGLKKLIEKKDRLDLGYGLEECAYHKELNKYKNW